QHLAHAVFAQSSHTQFAGSLAQNKSRGALVDHVAHFIVDHKNFEYAHSPFVANVTAQLAADRPHDLCIEELSGFDPKRAQLGVGKLTRLFAVAAQTTNQPLRHHGAHRRRNEKRLYAEIDQARNSGRRVIGVQRTENKVTGKTCIGGDACSLEIANLTDHDDVRRLAKDGPQRGRKRHTDLGVYLHLIYAGHLIFDRLFYRDDFAVRFIDVIETSVKRSGFARAGRSRHK